MIAFKSCPRCRGDLHAAGEEVSCLQCGYELQAEQKDAFLAKLAAARQKRLPIAA